MLIIRQQIQSLGTKSKRKGSEAREDKKQQKVMVYHIGLCFTTSHKKTQCFCSAMQDDFRQAVQRSHNSEQSVSGRKETEVLCS